MSNKRIKRLWFFEYYDFDLINTYLNNRVNQGEALEYIGIVFASYKKTTPGEYEYCVDYIEDCDVDSEEFECYKNTWTSERWEYVDFHEGMVIFRCKKQDRCVQPPINLGTIRAAILLKIKKQGKSAWLQSIMLVGVMIFNLIVNMDYKIVWIMAAAIQLLQIDSFLSYLSLRKKSKDGFNYHLDQSTADKCILKRQVMRCIKKILAGMIFILLPVVLIVYCKSVFLAKLTIIAAVLIVGIHGYSALKLYNRRQENKFDFKSKKGKFLLVSMIMIAITAVMLSFIFIDKSQPKRDIVKSIPKMTLECNDVIYHLEYDFGKWNYKSPSGILTGFEEEFMLPKPDQIEQLDRGNDYTIGISMAKKPNKVEVRYWNREDFNKLKSYDKGYKEIAIQDGSFNASNEDIVYVVYAEWEREYYDGVGYYVFTLEGE